MRKTGVDHLSNETIQTKESGTVSTMEQLDPKTVRKLEEKIEVAIAEVIVTMGLRKLPLLPARHTMHLMAKAAVTVYEAAVEKQREEH